MKYPVERPMNVENQSANTKNKKAAFLAEATHFRDSSKLSFPLAKVPTKSREIECRWLRCLDLEFQRGLSEVLRTNIQAVSCPGRIKEKPG